MKEKSVSQDKKKANINSSIPGEPHKMNKNLSCYPLKIIGNILEVDKVRTSKNGTENKKTIDKI